MDLYVSNQKYSMYKRKLFVRQLSKDEREIITVKKLILELNIIIQKAKFQEWFQCYRLEDLTTNTKTPKLKSGLKVIFLYSDTPLRFKASFLGWGCGFFS